MINADRIAIEVREVDGVIIRNVKTTGPGGIYFNGTNYSEASDSYLQAGAIGIDLNEVTESTIKNNIVKGPRAIFAAWVEGILIDQNIIEDGVEFDWAKDSILSKNKITREGVSLIDSQNIKVLNNLIRTDYGVGLKIQSGSNAEQHLIKGNTFNSAETAAHLPNAYVDGPTVSMRGWLGDWIGSLFNKVGQVLGFPSRVLADNERSIIFTQNNFFNSTIVEGGSGINALFSLPSPEGGNYWESFDEDHEGCVDADGDGWCDATYQINEDLVDVLARKQPLGNFITETSSPTNLGQFRQFGKSEIVAGGLLSSNSVVLKAKVGGVEGRALRLEVEVKKLGSGFDGLETKYSDWFTGDGVASVTFDNLIPKADQYEPGGNEDSFVWRARTVDEDGGASAWVKFGNGNADFKVKVVPLFTQVSSEFPLRVAEEEWSNKDYAGGRDFDISKGGCGRSIAQCGCAITSLVMLLRYEGIDTGSDGKSVNPLNLDAWLLSNDGYTKDNLVIWSVVDRYSKGRIKYNDAHNSIITKVSQPTLEDYSILDNTLQSGEPMPAIARSAYGRPRGGVNATHFFVIDSKVGEGEYTVRDPLWYRTRTLADSSAIDVRNYEGGFDGLRLFKRGEEYLSGEWPITVQHVLGSPAELLLTDSKGRRLGRDPRTGEEFREIPGGVYYLGDKPFYADLDNTTMPDTDVSKIMYIQGLLPGRYYLEVIGTGEGAYSLDTSIFDSNNRSTEDLIRGTTATGVIDTYSYTIDEDQFEKIIMEKIDTVQDPGNHYKTSSEKNIVSLSRPDVEVLPDIMDLYRQLLELLLRMKSLLELILIK